MSNDYSYLRFGPKPKECGDCEQLINATCMKLTLHRCSDYQKPPSLATVIVREIQWLFRRKIKTEVKNNGKQ